MSKEIKKITADEVYPVSMRRLGDRPNSSSAQGRGGMSSAELKGFMDKYPELVKERLNELIDMCNADSKDGIAKAIKTPVIDPETGNEFSLYDWFAYAKIYLKGDKGDTGVGIQSIEKRTGVVDFDDIMNGIDADHYRITLTNGETFDFKIKNGKKGDKGDKGDPFKIYKTYDSVDLMNADATNVPDGKMVLISSDVSDEDNAKLYVKSNDGFSFITDLSGAQGIKGEKGDKGDKGDSIEQIVSEASNTAQSVSYDSTSGATIEYKDKTVLYKDPTTGETKSKVLPAQLELPILPGKYMSMDANADNDALVVKVDDTALALDYIKIDKTKNAVVPQYDNGKIIWTIATGAPIPSTIVARNSDGNSYFSKLLVDRIATTANEYTVPTQAITYGGYSDGFTVEKTTTDTGTLTAGVFDAIKAYPNAGLKYDNQSYIRMNPINAPDGTLNYIHLDSIQNGQSGYKATGKCFSITVSTRAWQVVDLDFGGSTRTTHNLTLTNSATDTTIYFSLTNNRPETYEGAPAGLWSALENSPISCTVAVSGEYKSGIITIDGDNFKAFYGNSEELLMTQTQVGITDSIVV